MATAEARRLQEHDPRPVAVRGRKGRGIRWHPIWDCNPRLVRPERPTDGAQWLENYSGNRPYIDYGRSSPECFVFRDYRPQPGEIYLTDEERRPYRYLDGMVLIEPHIKAGCKPTKDWGWNRWQKVVQLLPRVPWVQIGMPNTKPLQGVKFIATPTVRAAAAVMSFMRAAVLPEGGLHHCAAALKVPAVVVFGGYIAPRVTGYELHRNLFMPRSDADLGCGRREFCVHCRDALGAITPRQVADELAQILEPTKAAA